MLGQQAQVAPFGIAHNAVGVSDALGTQVLFGVGFVGAAAVAAGQADALVVVAGQRGDAASAYLVHHFVGPGRIAHQVAEAENHVGPALLHVGQHRFQGRQVAVHVGEKRNCHRMQKK
uniref:Uncharacterized protein n=1 Tax=Tanacetum cinerariifolium TaxID=118510 RepID=A0A699UHT4_TANCI|nr:hypothetical protein [Tanacetum cinerariifolium]